jgi:spore coat polysaccharide biosynthesis predicted glycosyltransferase SpsG
VTLVGIVADGGEHAGLGHISRSSSVAVALRARGATVRCHAFGAAEPTVRDGVEWTPLDDPLEAAGDEAAMLIDSYTLGDEASEQIAAGRPTAVMLDEGDAPVAAAIVVAPGYPPRASGQGPLWLAGPRHACLRPGFWGLPERGPAPERVERVLVTTGGGDPGGVAERLAAAVRDAVPPGTNVALVRGPYAPATAPEGVELVHAPDSLLEQLASADLVVTAGGQTLLEAAAVGTPAIVVPLVANQRAQAEALAERGAARAAALDDVPTAVAAIAADAAARTSLSAAAQRAIDGHGALRVAYALSRAAG